MIDKGAVYWFEDGSAVSMGNGRSEIRERTETSRQRELERLQHRDLRTYFLRSRNRWAFWRKWMAI